MNIQKTEKMILFKKYEDWKDVKKLGSLIDCQVDVQHRIAIAKSAFNRLWKFWKEKYPLKERLRIQFYHVFIQPILLYNCSTWGLSKASLKQIKACNRTFLRQAIGIHWPQKIRNPKLYQRTKTKPLAEKIFTARWNCFAKILQMDITTPAVAHTRQYFIRQSNQCAKWSGRSNSNLITTIIDDLKSIGHRLINVNDFDQLIELAREPKQWQELTESMRKAQFRPNVDI